MIELKTSVLLAASLKLGAMIGGASIGNTDHIYQFGRNLGIAFQVQDDYLDCFGDPEKFGKQVGGDIKANKKTFDYHDWKPPQLLNSPVEELMQNNPRKCTGSCNFKSAGVENWPSVRIRSRKSEQHLEA